MVLEFGGVSCLKNRSVEQGIKNVEANVLLYIRLPHVPFSSPWLTYQTWHFMNGRFFSPTKAQASFIKQVIQCPFETRAT